MSYPPEGPPGGQYPPPPGFGPPPGYNQGGFGPPPPGYGPGGPGGMGGQPPYQEPIPNYMWQAIVLTVAGVLCCCFSIGISIVSSGLGIAALVTSSQVGEKQRMGDIQGALAASARIKKFLMIGVGFLVASFILAVIILGTADWDFYWTTD